MGSAAREVDAAAVWALVDELLPGMREILAEWKDDEAAALAVLRAGIEALKADRDKYRAAFVNLLGGEE